jgi:hypothetical protein
LKIIGHGNPDNNFESPYTFMKKFRINSCGSGYGPMVDSCKCGTEPLGSMGIFLDYLGRYVLLKDSSMEIVGSCEF